jgi:hypothetical protein
MIEEEELTAFRDVSQVLDKLTPESIKVVLRLLEGYYLPDKRWGSF